jgi:hypothetical protein
MLSNIHVAFFFALAYIIPNITNILILLLFLLSAAIMSGYAQLMKKTGAMTKKGKKETPVQNLVRELLTDHRAQSPGASQGPAAMTADVAATSPKVQVAKKRKVVLRNRQKSPVVALLELEAVQSAPQNEISISDDEEAETVGLALRRKRG